MSAETSTRRFAYHTDGLRAIKIADGATTRHDPDLAATLPVVISDTEAVYLYGLDIIAEQLAGAERYYYVHDGLGSVRQVLDNTGQIATAYAYDPFGLPLAGNGVPNPWQFTGEAWDAGVELLYLRARYYQPETGRFITKDPWPGDVSRPGTLNGHDYVQNNPVNYIDPSGLRVWAGKGLPALCTECQPPPPPPPVDNPQRGRPHIPLEERVGVTTLGPIVMGGQFWLSAAVERDPLVNHVYVALRRSLEQQYRLQHSAIEPTMGWTPMDPRAFVCRAIRDAGAHMRQYAPVICASRAEDDCERLTLRIALNALAATVQRIAGRIAPAIPFEQEKESGSAEPGSARVPIEKIRHNVLPWIEAPLSPLPEWDRSGGVYSLEEGDPRWDKSYHFFTHAFMAYELRWIGRTPYAAWRLNDWQGRMLEQFRGPYSLNDVIANRWGTAFGLTAFEEPGRLIQRCIGEHCSIGLLNY